MGIKRVLVIGVRTDGERYCSSNAYQGGLEVTIRDIKAEYVQKGITGIERNLAKSVEKGKLSADEKEAIMKRISGTVS